MAQTATNFDEMVKASAKPKTAAKSKKQTKEIITNAPQAVKKAISKLIKAKSDKKKAESEIKVNENPIIEFGHELKDGRALDGDYNKSYKIQGDSDDDVVTFVTANKFSHKEDDEEELEEIMGDDFEELMPKSYSIKVKAEIFNDPDMQKELMERMGDKFNEFFEVESSRKVIDTFDEELYKRFDKDQIDDIKVFVKQSKPSLR